jgi:hypothetical protein
MQNNIDFSAALPLQTLKKVSAVQGNAANEIIGPRYAAFNIRRLK